LFILTLERLMIPPNVRVGVLTGVLGGIHDLFDFRDGDAPPCRERRAVKCGALRGSVVVVGFAAAFGGAFLARNL
jgi:hypothetical protein